MALDGTPGEDGPAGAEKSQQNRILDRKIERRALPESFSSNLGRKGGSPSGRKMPDRSVRAMVSLFEKSTAASDSTPPSRPRQASGTSTGVGVGDGERSSKDSRGIDRSDHSNDTGHDKSTDERQAPRQHRPQRDRGCPESTIPSMLPSVLPSARVTYQVEDYSLTLLKHKSYFSNRPLARCLDDYPEEDEDREEETGQVRSKNGDHESVPTKGQQNARIENGQASKQNSGSSVPDRHEILSPIQRLDGLMSDLLTWQTRPGAHEPNPTQQREHRNPHEVKDFWTNVRIQLWIDEEEVYGERARWKGGEDGENVEEVSKETQALVLSNSTSTFPSYHSDTEPKLPFPPAPTRPPPPVPVAPRGRALTAISSGKPHHWMASLLEIFSDPAPDYPARNQSPSASSVRLSISAPGCLDIADFLANGYPEHELPTLPQPKRPLPAPAPAKEPSHSRYPSSCSSSTSTGPWARPPTWRSLSSMIASSPPPQPVPPLPVPLPAAPASTTADHRANYSRHRYYAPQSSKTSTTSSTSFSGCSVAAVSGGTRVQMGRSPEKSTGSTAARCTRAGSAGSDAMPSSAGGRPRVARRRLTAEEKLSEIDAFLSP